MEADEGADSLLGDAVKSPTKPQRNIRSSGSIPRQGTQSASDFIELSRDDHQLPSRPKANSPTKDPGGESSVENVCIVHHINNIGHRVIGNVCSCLVYL